MSHRVTLPEFLASMQEAEEKIDQTIRSIERCIDHFSHMEEQIKGNMQRLQASGPHAAPIAGASLRQTSRPFADGSATHLTLLPRR